MNKQDQLEELLVDWGLARQQGNDLSVEELCKDDHDLIPDLSRLISDIKATDWLEEDDDSDDDFLHLPDFSTVSNRGEDTQLRECKLPVDEFCQRLVESELMEQSQVDQLTQQFSTDNARAFAQHLVEDKKLTTFQAMVLLGGRDIPLVLDRYVLLSEIGKGGMGAVYKALHQQMDRVVALKILPKDAVDSPEKVKRFHREVRVAAKLEHPNIVTTHDANEDKGYHYLVMSLVNGSDLAALVRKQGPLSVTRAVDYIAQAARGLEHAHQLGIVHRDIKPGNLLLNKKGKVKILDMGLARIDGGEVHEDHTVSMELTEAGAVMGTVAYLPPEQALDTRTADARSDIYSLGCTLYFLLTGRAIYVEDTMMKTIMAHREQDAPSLCDERQSVQAELDVIFQKMVAKTPEDRFQSMTELVTALETLEIEDDDGTQPVVAGSQSFHDTATFVDTSREAIEPQPDSVGEPPKRRWGWIAVCLLAVGGLYGAWASGIFFKLETPEGTIVLEIDQPGLAGAVVSVDGKKTITIQPGKDQEPIEVSADEKKHTLKVVKGGFETFTKEFTVKAGGKRTIEVRLEPLKKETAASPEDSQWDDRKVAEWVISVRGFVSGKTATTAFTGTNQLEKLPSVPFQITAITIADQSITDDDVRQLASLSSLERLSLSAAITDAGLAHLARLSSLRTLGVNTQRQLTDRGLTTLQNLTNLGSLYLTCEHHSISGQGIEAIAKLPNLKMLNIHLSPGLIDGSSLEGLENLKRLEIGGGIRIDEEFVNTLSKCEQLEHLELSGSSTKLTDSAVNQLKTLRRLRLLAIADFPITDGCIESLAELKKLEKLTLLKTRVTLQGIAELQKALPDCKIEHDLSEKEIQTAPQGLKAKENIESAIQESKAEAQAP